jgi:hypothetical protein
MHTDEGPLNKEAQDKAELWPWVDPHGLQKIEEVWWKDGRRVVTENMEQRRQLVHDHHDLPAYGHPGISRTAELVSRHYWWPRLRQDVMDYVKGCTDCQHNKVNTHTQKVALSPIFAKPNALPFETVAMDFIIKLPQSEGYDSILTIRDHDCTKMMVFIPCNESISAEGVAQLYLQHVFKNYGLPQKIISNRDMCFTGKFMQELCQILGIQQNMSTAYHPRPTDNQNKTTNGWNSSSASTSTKIRRTGRSTSPWPSSCITRGETRAQGTPHSKSSWDIAHVQNGRLCRHPYLR